MNARLRIDGTLRGHLPQLYDNAGGKLAVDFLPDVAFGVMMRMENDLPNPGAPATIPSRKFSNLTLTSRLSPTETICVSKAVSPA